VLHATTLSKELGKLLFQVAISIPAWNLATETNGDQLFEFVSHPKTSPKGRRAAALLRMRQVPSLVAIGSALTIVCVYSVLRAFKKPIASYESLRWGKILLALPVCIFAMGTFLAAWPATLPYAPWVILVAILVFFGVSRPFVKKLPR
jgi:hypothetical protein